LTTFCADTAPATVNSAAMIRELLTRYRQCMYVSGYRW
jgi:hypothetical protein